MSTPEPAVAPSDARSLRLLRTASRFKLLANAVLALAILCVPCLVTCHSIWSAQPGTRPGVISLPSAFLSRTADMVLGTLSGILYASALAAKLALVWALLTYLSLALSHKAAVHAPQAPRLVGISRTPGFSSSVSRKP